MAICGFGEGLEPGLQSFGSYLVKKESHANFFSFVSMLDVVGDLLGGPIMAAAYTIRGPDHLPAGYCFLLSAVSLIESLYLTKVLSPELGFVQRPSREYWSRKDNSFVTNERSLT